MICIIRVSFLYFYPHSLFMIPQIHYFNPGHETAVLLGNENYTPPANVLRMTKELAFLPVWYAEDGDYVFTEEITSPRFFSLQPKALRPFATLVSRKELYAKASTLPEMKATPWGLSPNSIHLFNELKRSSLAPITVPEWKEQYFSLTGRQTAAVCLEKMRELLPELTLPVAPKFCTKIRDIEKYLILQNAPFILKTPYSSSGRGLLWLPERKLSIKDKAWIEGAFKKQGVVSIECALKKKLDFALEFYSDGKGKVVYKGLSVFDAGSRGSYSGNVLGSQEYLSSYFIEKFGEETFNRIIEVARLATETIYGSIYTGYLGIDMLVYEKSDSTYAIHPCIEINMRYTMGMAAIHISQKYLATNARGDFHITYESHPGDAYEKHCFMKKAYPLELENGKIREGYLSLCPVTKETKYRAYILVF